MSSRGGIFHEFTDKTRPQDYSPAAAAAYQPISMSFLRSIAMSKPSISASEHTSPA